MNPWLIREAEARDLNFIYASWLNSYRHGSPLGKSVRNTIFFQSYPSIIDHLLEKPEVKTLIAYFSDSPEVILSYMVYEPHILHYIYTKEAYMRNGVAKSLLEKAFEPIQNQYYDYTHRTDLGARFIDELDQFRFNPFHLYQLGDSK